MGGFPNWDVWGEWNGKFRDDVRRFIKGDAGVKAAFATRIAGSADLYHVNNRWGMGMPHAWHSLGQERTSKLSSS